MERHLKADNLCKYRFCIRQRVLTLNSRKKQENITIMKKMCVMRQDVIDPVSTKWIRIHERKYG